MKTITAFLAPFLSAALLFVAGCNTAPKSPTADLTKRDKTLQAFTPINSNYRYVMARELTEPATVVLAVVDVDFSHEDGVILGYTPAAYRPGNTERLHLSALEPTRAFSSIGDLHDAIRTRYEGGPIALLMMLDGNPIGYNGLDFGSAEQQFLNYFTGVLEGTGLSFAYLIPESAIVRRADP